MDPTTALFLIAPVVLVLVILAFRLYAEVPAHDWLADPIYGVDYEPGCIHALPVSQCPECARGLAAPAGSDGDQGW